MKLKFLDNPNNVEQWGPLDGIILYMSFWYYPCGPGVTKQWGVSWPELIANFSNDRMTFYWERQQMQECGEKALQTWLLPKSKLSVLQKEYRKVWKGCEALEKKVGTSLKNNASKKTIVYLASQTYKHIYDFWCVSLVFETANYGAPGYLEKQLQGKLPTKDMPHALEVLLAPTSLSFHQQEELELFKKYVQAKNPKQLSKLMELHAKKWYWVENSYYECKNLSAEYFLSRVQKTSKAIVTKKIKAIESYEKRTKLQKQTLVKKYALGKQILSLANLLSFSIWWQDDRKAKIWRINSLIEELTIKSAEIYSLPIKDAHLYNAEEWVLLNKTGKKLSQKQLRDRASITAITISPTNYNMQSGSAAKKILLPFLKKITQTQTGNSLSGIVVSKGKTNVTGKVRIVISPHKDSKMQQGEILVAPMTSPDFVPLMRKASAIITDVGGLMSHAAVISRELGIPCITGTKFATKMLKDGDIVEVDANKGIIKKIN